MSAHQEVKVKQSSEGDDATTIPLDVIHHQSEFFDKLKQFLLSQQNSLRQNLETVKEKTGKSTLTRNQVNINGERSKESDPSNPSTNSSNSEAPVATQRVEIQICPICGMEFDGGNEDALETHVAEHWCSSEFRGLSN